jgi:protein-S-isoprenylcysteine O-methyltransferase Ste14
MAGITIFLLGTLGFLKLSWNAFSNPHKHGFPRFFAFEAILGLVVVNGKYWLIDPLSLAHIISWILLLLSFFLAWHGFRLLKIYGKPDPQIQDDQRQSIEKTTRLVTIGAYRYIRHPLYTSLLCLAWGVFLKNINVLSACLVVLASAMLYLTASWEEAENLVTFGEDYAEYIHHTHRFIPFLF